MKKILLVHDDTGISYLIQQLIETPETDFTLVKNYEEVEAILENNASFDIIITDISVDGIFSNQYLEYLNSKLPNASILVISEMNQTQIKKEAVELGIEDFIDLPISIKDLQQKINKHL